MRSWLRNGWICPTGQVWGFIYALQVNFGVYQYLTGGKKIGGPLGVPTRKKNVFAFPLFFFRTFVFLFPFRLVPFHFASLRFLFPGSQSETELWPFIFFGRLRNHSLPLNAGVWTAGFSSFFCSLAPRLTQCFHPTPSVRGSSTWSAIVNFQKFQKNGLLKELPRNTQCSRANPSIAVCGRTWYHCWYKSQCHQLRRPI